MARGKISRPKSGSGAPKSKAHLSGRSMRTRTYQIGYPEPCILPDAPHGFDGRNDRGKAFRQLDYRDHKSPREYFQDFGDHPGFHHERNISPAVPSNGDPYPSPRASLHDLSPQNYDRSTISMWNEEGPSHLYKGTPNFSGLPYSEHSPPLPYGTNPTPSGSRDVGGLHPHDEMRCPPLLDHLPYADHFRGRNFMKLNKAPRRHSKRRARPPRRYSRDTAKEEDWQSHYVGSSHQDECQSYQPYGLSNSLQPSPHHDMSQQQHSDHNVISQTSEVPQDIEQYDTSLSPNHPGAHEHIFSRLGSPRSMFEERDILSRLGPATSIQECVPKSNPRKGILNRLGPQADDLRLSLNGSSCDSHGTQRLTSPPSGGDEYAEPYIPETELKVENSIMQRDRSPMPELPFTSGEYNNQNKHDNSREPLEYQQTTGDHAIVLAMSTIGESLVHHLQQAIRSLYEACEVFIELNGSDSSCNPVDDFFIKELNHYHNLCGNNITLWKTSISCHVKHAQEKSTRRECRDNSPSPLVVDVPESTQEFVGYRPPPEIVDEIKSVENLKQTSASGAKMNCVEAEETLNKDSESLSESIPKPIVRTCNPLSVSLNGGETREECETQSINTEDSCDLFDSQKHLNTVKSVPQPPSPDTCSEPSVSENTASSSSRVISQKITSPPAPHKGIQTSCSPVPNHDSSLNTTMSLYELCVGAKLDDFKVDEVAILDKGSQLEIAPTTPPASAKNLEIKFELFKVPDNEAVSVAKPCKEFNGSNDQTALHKADSLNPFSKSKNSSVDEEIAEVRSEFPTDDKQSTATPSFEVPADLSTQKYQKKVYNLNFDSEQVCTSHSAAESLPLSCPVSDNDLESVEIARNTVKPCGESSVKPEKALCVSLPSGTLPTFSTHPVMSASGTVDCYVSTLHKKPCSSSHALTPPIPVQSGLKNAEGLASFLGMVRSSDLPQHVLTGSLPSSVTTKEYMTCTANPSSSSDCVQNEFNFDDSLSPDQVFVVSIDLTKIKIPSKSSKIVAVSKDKVSTGCSLVTIGSDNKKHSMIKDLKQVQVLHEMATPPEPHTAHSPATNRKSVSTLCNARRSLSPGEIVSSSSASPPPVKQSPRNASQQRRRRMSSEHRPHGPMSSSHRSHGVYNSRQYRQDRGKAQRDPPSYTYHGRRRKTSPKKNDRLRRTSGRKSRNNRESDEELELLSLRKQVLMSMIQENGNQVVIEEPQVEQRKIPGEELLQPQDNHEPVSMDLCSPISDDEECSDGNIGSILLGTHDISDHAATDISIPVPNTETSHVTQDVADERPCILKGTTTSGFKQAAFEEEHTTSNQVRQPVIHSRRISPSIKIVPADRNTWKVGSFVLSDNNDDALGSPASNVSKFLLQARKISEAAKQNTLPNSSDAPQKKQYLQLKMKLELQERFKQLRIEQANASSINNQETIAESDSLVGTTTKIIPSKTKSGEEPKTCLSSMQISQTLADCEREVERSQDDHRKNVTELELITDKLNESDERIEESKFKIQALKAQLQQLQKEIQSAEDAINEDTNRKTALLTKLRVVKKNFGESEKKVDEATLKLKASRSLFDSQNVRSTGTISEDKALLSLKSYKSGLCSSSAEVSKPSYSTFTPSISVTEPSLDSESSYNIGELHSSVTEMDSTPSATLIAVPRIEPISDSECSENTCSTSILDSKSCATEMSKATSSTSVSVAEIEPISDCEGSTSALDLPALTIHSKSVKDVVDRVASCKDDKEISNQFKPGIVHVGSSECTANSSGEDECTSLCSQIPDVFSSTTAPIISQKPNYVEKVVCLSSTNSDDPDKPLGNDEQSIKSYSASSQHCPEAAVRPKKTRNRLVSNNLRSRKTRRRLLSNDLRSRKSKGRLLSNDWTIARDKIFFNGSKEVFSLSDNEPRDIVLPHFESTLDVTPACISSIVLPILEDSDQFISKVANPRNALQPPIKEIASELTIQDNLSPTNSICLAGSQASSLNIASEEFEPSIFEGSLKRPDEIYKDECTSKRLKLDNSAQIETSTSTSKAFSVLCSVLGELSGKKIMLNKQKVHRIFFDSLDMQQFRRKLLDEFSFLPCQLLEDMIVSMIINEEKAATVHVPHGLVAFSDIQYSISEVKYQQYQSPLLAFFSSQLNPFYRKFSEFHIGSPTYANNLDPTLQLCKYDLLGVCKDPNCSDQHFDTLTKSDEEIFSDLKSCIKFDGSQKQLSDCLSKKTQHLKNLSEVEAYSASRHQFITFCHSSSSGSNTSAPFHVQSSCAKPAHISPKPMGAAPDTVLDVRPRRYYEQQSSVGADHASSLGEVSEFLKVSKQYKAKGDVENYMRVLREALQLHSTSVELHSELIKAHSLFGSEVFGRQSLSEICSLAFESTKSYALILEIIRSNSSYDWKRKWLRRGMDFFLAQTPNDTRSHQCLELFVNDALLMVSVGRVDEALRIMDIELFQSSRLREFLKPIDLQFACAYFILILYCKRPVIKPCMDVSGVFPFAIVSKNISINWKINDCDRPTTLLVLKYLKECTELYGLLELPKEKPEICFSLLFNIITFEMEIGEYSAAAQLLDTFLEKQPHTVELWVLYIKIVAKTKQSLPELIERALLACPSSPQLYYSVAMIELSEVIGPRIDKAEAALLWLDKCILSYFTSDLPDGVDTALLYRKLIGEVVPYDINLPSFDGAKECISGIDQAYLWLCYCLLIELREPVLPTDIYQQCPTVSAYESAVHSVLDRRSQVLLWRGYLSYLRSQCLSNPKSSTYLKQYMSATKRCLRTVTCFQSNDFPNPIKNYRYEDHSFHNEVIEMFLGIVHCTRSQTLSLLQEFRNLLPDSNFLLTKTVLCALDQEIPLVDEAQSLLALYLARSQNHLSLWKLATSIETDLGNRSEIRWMYNQAVAACPNDLTIWMGFLMFELSEVIKEENTGSESNTKAVKDIISNAGNCGIDLYAMLS